MSKDEDRNDNTKNLFPSVTKALGDYLSDEEGNITRSKVVTLAGIAIVLGTLYGLNVQASHRSHSSHSSHLCFVNKKSPKSEGKFPSFVLGIPQFRKVA